MQPMVEILTGLERRVDLAIPVADVEKDVQTQLKQAARTAKVAGFRPGKVPLSVMERTRGAAIRYDVIGSHVDRKFKEVVEQANLRVAGTAGIAPKQDATQEGVMTFSVTFEVYPDIELPDLGSLQVKRSQVEITDAHVQQTLETLRKQRVTWKPDATRAAQDNDRITLDFSGTIDDTAFAGGTAQDFSFELGQGRMLAEFETAVRGMKAGEQKRFPLTFPEDYAGKEVAGKEAQFEITVKEVAEPVLPTVDAAFAQSLGHADGDVDKLLADIRKNLEREVKSRCQARNKQSALEALAAATQLNLPKVLVEEEVQARMAAAREDLQRRGIPNAATMELPQDMFREEAQRRVRLGMVTGALIRRENMQAQPEQVRAWLEDMAQSYDQPEQVVAYYLADRARLSGVENIVLENNVVEYILSQAQVTDESLDFDTVMGLNPGNV